MRRGWITACLLACAGGLLFAQGARAPGDGLAQDALLAEIRALRAEIHHLVSASIQTQLLVARLELQEQRVYLAARQLAEAQADLAAVRQELTSERERIRQLQDLAARTTSQNPAALQQAIVEAEHLVQLQQRKQLQLQEREAELLRTAGDAQVQWTNFNDRLVAIERSLQAAISR